MILSGIAAGLRDEEGTMRRVTRAPISRVPAALAGALAILALVAGPSLARPGVYPGSGSRIYEPRDTWSNSVSSMSLTAADSAGSVELDRAELEPEDTPDSTGDSTGDQPGDPQGADENDQGKQQDANATDDQQADENDDAQGDDQQGDDQGDDAGEHQSAGDHHGGDSGGDGEDSGDGGSDQEGGD